MSHSMRCVPMARSSASCVATCPSWRTEIMKKPAATHAPGAALLFGGLACVFIVLFGLIVTLLVSDQRSLQASVTKLRAQSLPLSIEQQRLGAKPRDPAPGGWCAYSQPAPQDRQQAMFVVNLMASHPGILANPTRQDMATETELFPTRMRAASGKMKCCRPNGRNFPAA